MAGTLAALPLSQQFGSNGALLPGCLLYIYEAGTTTPVDTYPTSALVSGQEQVWPLVADAAARIPNFWVDNGTYRARLTTSAGVVVFDEDGILAIGPSTGDPGGDTTPASAVFTTGLVDWQPVSGTRSGWVRCNARTIGSAASGASERANADCQALYEWLWNNVSDSRCPVTGGRGANAAADWAANKPIATPDGRGLTPIGLADMGNSDSGTLDDVTFSLGDKTTAMSYGGSAFHTLTEAELATHDHTATSTVTDPGHFHRAGDAVLGGSPSGTGMRENTGSGNAGDTDTKTTGITVATTVANAGSGGAHNNMQPFWTGTYYIKL